ncbi:sensor domain-containing diguanylate cyclase [Jeongeupia sp. HS-3]|uniref:diguanylate cyclase n=1 Tax=Jeongeupia sp. HS-3 TaxID=1009682 RepID=UPI0018A3583F|nr:diguanylate cyclase [Jeongeupia sp. HS-3]BCL74910.1 sensor domain-containing diguanylate cyclase [Jeongeupia sp. HS-3]
MRWFALLLLSLATLAQSAVTLMPQTQMLNPAPAVTYFEDRGGLLTIDEVRRQHHAFKPLASATHDPNFGYSHSAYWLKLTLRRDAAAPANWLLEIGYPSLDRILAYPPDKAAPLLLGDRLPFAHRPMANRNFLIPFSLPPGESEFYLRVTSEGNLTVPLRVWQPAAFQQHNQDEYAMLALYYGMLLALALYNLLLFFSLREPIYLVYVAFAASMAVGQLSLNGLGNQYPWPDWPQWGNVALPSGFAATGFFGALFTRMFLDTGRFSPKADRLIVVLMIGFGLAALAPALLPYQWAAVVTSLLGAAFSLLAVVVGVLCWRRRQPGARYFLLAWSLLLVGVAMMAMRNLAWLPTNPLTSNTMQIGSALEMLLLSFALADRIQASRKQAEAAQTELLATREMALRSSRESEQVLEAKVAERTQALTDANARLALSEAQLTRLAHHDVLTGLPNRLLLHDRLKTALSRIGRNGGRLALLLIDVDGFKAVNDCYGHDVGDQLLKVIAEILQQQVRASDTVARLGGDEFVVLLENVTEPDDAERIAMQINEAVRGVHHAVGISLAVSASIGIALPAERNAEVSVLIRQADQAMYRAKAKGRDGWCLA